MNCRLFRFHLLRAAIVGLISLIIALPPVTAHASNSSAPKNVTIPSAVAESMLIEKSGLVYPPIAKAAHISGTVVLQAIITRAGGVKELHVVNGPVLLQQAALTAVKTWRYRPYRLNGKAVDVQTTINVEFTLADEAASTGTTAAPAIDIKDPVESKAYQQAIAQSDLKLKASQLEYFLQSYPQSSAKEAVLDTLMFAYLELRDADKSQSAASRLLELNPSNVKALSVSSLVKLDQCTKSGDPKACDDAGQLARKGLSATRPETEPAADWKRITSAAYPVYHSAIAWDNLVAKKDMKSAIQEFRIELTFYTENQARTGLGLVDTGQLADAYVNPEAENLQLAVWLYARAWNYALAINKPHIEERLEYYYRKAHGNLDGLDVLKTQSAALLFPPGTPAISVPPAEFYAKQLIEESPTAKLIHSLIEDTPNLASLSLADRRYILATGVKEDADKLWQQMKGQPAAVTGTVLEANANVIKLAVTLDAKASGIPDFVVQMKTPLDSAQIPAAGFEFQLQPNSELVGIYDSYTPNPAGKASVQSAQLVLNSGSIKVRK